MYKVGIMLMGKPQSSLATVKEIVLEVQSKTRVKFLLEYLREEGKISDANFYISLEKKGRPISDDSTISQILKHIRPENGLIKLYLYEGDESSLQKIQLKRSRHQVNSSSRVSPQKMRSSQLQTDRQQERNNRSCCCW